MKAGRRRPAASAGARFAMKSFESAGSVEVTALGSGGGDSEMGRRGYGGLGTKQIVLTIRPSEALASCCGVNLAGADGGGGFFAGRAISVWRRRGHDRQAVSADASRLELAPGMK